MAVIKARDPRGAAEGAVASAVPSVLIKTQKQWTELVHKIKYVCPMNVETFGKEESFHWCEAGSGFSHPDEAVWPKLLTQFTCNFAGFL